MEDFNPDDEPKEPKREDEEEGDLVGHVNLCYSLIVAICTYLSSHLSHTVLVYLVISVLISLFCCINQVSFILTNTGNIYGKL